MSLTPKQEKFCVEYVKTGNAAAAYRESYNSAKMSIASISQAVNELLANPKITLRVAELQAPAAKKAQITLESHLERLEHLSNMAEQSNQIGAAITAETNRGKAVGIYIERSVVDVKVDMGQVNERIAALLEKLGNSGRQSRR